MRTFVLAAAAALLLGSCSSDPEPIEPKSSTSAPTPSPAAPTLPDSATEDTPSGAANFVAHWIKTSNYAAVTGDVQPLQKISDPGCGGCNAYLKLYESTYADGGYFRGGDRSIGHVQVEFGGPEVFISGEVHAGAGSYRRDSDSSAKPSSVESNPVDFAARYSGGRWQMTQVGLGSDD